MIDDVDVQYASEDDVQGAIDLALEQAGLTLDQLTDEARLGRFSSENARMAWWVVSGFVAGL